MKQFKAIREVPGLYFLENVITEEEETEMLLECPKKGVQFSMDNPQTVTSLQGNSDNFPEWLQMFWVKALGETNLSEIIHETGMFDNCFVNRYRPGSNIPPHTDNAYDFGDWILGLSLGSEVKMDFALYNYNYYQTEYFGHGSQFPNGKKHSLRLPRRSVYQV